MNTPVEPPAIQADEREEILADFRVNTRDQLQAAWQLHVDRVEDELSKGWHAQIAQVIDERFASLSDVIEREVSTRTSVAVDSKTRSVTEQLNQAARRLRQATESDEWVSALLDASAAFCGCASLFRVGGAKLTLEASIGLAEGNIEIALTDAPAFENAVQSLEPVTAMASAGELSESVLALAPTSPDGKVSLLPVVSQGKAVAVLFAQGGEKPLDWNALELLTNLAGALLASESGPSPSELVTIEEPASSRGKAAPAWSELSKEDQDRHLRAQRFARVQVAELRLYKSQPVKEGRAERDLYGKLREEIDTGRAAFRKDYMNDCPSMVDYYHLELVRTLANDEEALLGPEYPGPLE